MTLSLIGLGSANDDGNGDTARVGGAKINSCVAAVNSMSPPGPGNTPGFGASVTSYGPMTTVMSNWSTGANWAQLGPTSLVRAAASSGNTDVHGIVSSGATEGQYWGYYNPSPTDSTKFNNESALCTSSADRLLTPGAGISVVGPQGHATFRRDAVSNRWTRVS